MDTGENYQKAIDDLRARVAVLEEKAGVKPEPEHEPVAPVA